MKQAAAGTTEGHQATEGQTEEELNDEDSGDKSDVEIITERPEMELAHNGEDHYGAGDDQQQQQEGDDAQANAHQGYAMNQSQQGFGNMGFNAMNGFNNPMMAMQGGMGMQGFGMGMPNMMGMLYNQYLHRVGSQYTGMPGMSMDPSMMMGNNFGGMGGMNNMNMMASMMGNGGFGAGMPGMGMNQGFGMNGGGGYNRFGNHYNQQQPFHPNARGYNRPYGRGSRGRGGYGFGRGGRGGFNQFGPGPGFNQDFQNGMPNAMQQQQQLQQQQLQQQQQDSGQPSGDTGSTGAGAGRASPTYESMAAANGESGDANVEARPPGEEANDPTNEPVKGTNTADGENGDAMNVDDHAKNDPTTAGHDQGESSRLSFRDDYHCTVRTRNTKCMNNLANNSKLDGLADPNQAAQGGFNNPPDFYGNPIQSFEFSEYDNSGTFGGSFNGMGEPVSAPPVNAPTGPKAMREGLPNSGWYSRPQVSQTPSNANVPASAEPTGEQSQGSIRGRSAEREAQDDDRDRELERSRSRHASRRQRRRDEADDYESDATYERRKERERRKRRDRERRDDGRSSGRARSRSASPTDDSSYRRRHRRDNDKDSRDKRSRRDRERSRDKRRSDYRDRSPDDFDSRKSRARPSRREEDDRSSRRSSRRRHDETRSSKHSRRSSRDRDRDRERDRDRDRRGLIEQPADDIGFKIKGSHSNRRGMPPPANSSSPRRGSDAPSTAAATDPYAAERELHKQERALREQQRRQSSTQSLGKRGREDEEAGGAEESGGRKRRDGRSRKISAKYEGEIDDGENEREMARWR